MINQPLPSSKIATNAPKVIIAGPDGDSHVMAGPFNGVKPQVESSQAALPGGMERIAKGDGSILTTGHDKNSVQDIDGTILTPGHKNNVLDGDGVILTAGHTNTIQEGDGAILRPGVDKANVMAGPFNGVLVNNENIPELKPQAESTQAALPGGMERIQEGDGMILTTGHPNSIQEGDGAILRTSPDKTNVMAGPFNGVLTNNENISELVNENVPNVMAGPFNGVLTNNENIAGKQTNLDFDFELPPIAPKNKFLDSDGSILRPDIHKNQFLDSDMTILTAKNNVVLEGPDGDTHVMAGPLNGVEPQVESSQAALPGGMERIQEGDGAILRPPINKVLDGDGHILRPGADKVLDSDGHILRPAPDKVLVNNENISGVVNENVHNLINENVANMETQFHFDRPLQITGIAKQMEISNVAMNGQSGLAAGTPQVMNYGPGDHVTETHVVGIDTLHFDILI